MESGIIFGNRILDVVFLAWAVAQGYKVMEELITTKKVRLSTIWTTGGMPSSHTSTVTSLATCIAVTAGFKSVEFSMVAIFAGVVMYDAAGIRRAAGKQAGIINKIVEKITQNPHITGIQEEKLKELLGHTPFEVLIGAILGIIIGIVFRGYLI
ncbi:MAG: divergent PAP2 family protein [Fusobacteriaceae bacterium]